VLDEVSTAIPRDRVARNNQFVCQFATVSLYL